MKNKNKENLCKKKLSVLGPKITCMGFFVGLPQSSYYSYYSVLYLITYYSVTTMVVILKLFPPDHHLNLFLANPTHQSPYTPPGVGVLVSYVCKVGGIFIDFLRRVSMHLLLSKIIFTWSDSLHSKEHKLWQQTHVR